jgi:hypothetical protein
MSYCSLIASVIKDRFPNTDHRRQTTFRITHEDIKGIICFVPIANSPTEWRTVSLPINVKGSFLELEFNVKCVFFLT